MYKGSIVVSLRARGVYTYQFQKLLDIKAQVKRFFKQIVDIGCSAIVLLQLQSWTTWFSVLVMLLSIIFYINEDGHEFSTTGGFWLAVCFIVVLPLLGLLGLVRCLEQYMPLCTLFLHGHACGHPTPCGLCTHHQACAACNEPQQLTGPTTQTFHRREVALMQLAKGTQHHNLSAR
jgi:hypothetical protein